MRRRDFIHAGAVVGAGSLAGLTPRFLQERPDLVLRRAVVFDGSRAPGVEADVAIVADRIAHVGRISATGREEIDLAGQALCPGFIDIHTHVELSMLVNRNVESRIRQGVTLEIAGQCGGSVGPWTDDVYQETRESYRDNPGR